MIDYALHVSNKVCVSNEHINQSFPTLIQGTCTYIHYNHHTAVYQYSH